MIMQLCPFCASENIFFSKKRNKFFCEDCENGFQTPSVMKGMRIFLSYGHDKNSKIVKKIKTYLVSKGFDVWIDTSEIPAGKDWRERITNGLIGSNGVISFLSKHSVRDPGVCLDELRIAVCLKQAYVKTVLLESEAEVTPPSIVRNTQWLDMSDWDHIPEAHWDDYFQAKMDLLIEALHSDDAATYNEELEFLSRELGTNHNTAKQQRLLKQMFVGRDWLTEKVISWFDSPAPEPFLIFGVPGSGKSAFSANLAQFNPDVLASLFFEWDHAEFHSLDLVIKHMAFRLSSTISDYRRMLCNIYHNESEKKKLEQYHGATLFDCIVLNPLQCCIGGNREKGLIIFDGLDETTPEIADFLIRKSSQFPDWIKVLFTSRYDETLAPRMKQSHTVMLDQSHAQNAQDISQYLAYRTGLPTDHPIVCKLAEKCEGSFMYATTFCDAVDSGNMSLEDVHTVPFGLNNFYYTFFKRLFPTGDRFLEIRPFLELLCIDEDVPEEILAQCLNLDHYGLWELRLAVKSLVSNAQSNCGSGNATKFKTIRFSHQSIKDWLTAPHSAGEFFVDVRNGYRQLARRHEAASSPEPALPSAEGADWYKKLQSLDPNNVSQSQLEKLQQLIHAWRNSTQDAYEDAMHKQALSSYLKKNYVKWLILGGEYSKAKELLMDSFDEEELKRNFNPLNYQQYYKFFTIWQWADLFPLSYPIDDLVEKFTQIALYPREYVISQFAHRSFQIVMLTLRHIMDSGRYHVPFFKVIRSFQFAAYFTSRASDDFETRDGWDKYYTARDAAICIKKLDKCGIPVPQDIRAASEAMKLTYNYESGNPNGGMFYGSSGRSFSYGILSEPELFKDLYTIDPPAEKIGSGNTLDLLTHYNTTSLHFYLANSDETDLDFIRRCLDHHADLSVASERAIASIRNKLDPSAPQTPIPESYARRIAFIRSLSHSLY